MSEALARRVKLYQLNDEGQWDDKGTGHVCYQEDEGEELLLTVRCEESGNDLLEHRVEGNIDYQRQGETIITWCEVAKENGMPVDLALSFQEVARCNEVWDQVSIAQSKAGKDLMHIDQHDDKPYSDLDSDSNDLNDILLPEPCAVNLKDICTQINQVVQMATPVQKDSVASCLLRDDYMNRLYEAFRDAEDLEQVEACYLLFNISKAIFMLNDVGVFEQILSDEFILKMIAMLEYDPDLPAGTQFNRHRSFLENASFMDVVEIPDEEVVSKIHQNYRVIYIRDVILLRYLDDNAVGTLSSIIFFNNVMIVTRLSENKEFVGNLFTKLQYLAPKSQLKSTAKITAPTPTISSSSNASDSKDKSTENTPSSSSSSSPSTPQHLDAMSKTLFGDKPPTFETRKNLFLFLQELCTLAKTLQVPIREVFYKTLIEFDVFTVIETALINSCPRKQHWLWLCIIDILTNILTHNPSPFRTFLNTRIGAEKSLLNRFFRLVVADRLGAGLAHQIAQVIRMILDPETMELGDSDCEVFLDHVYDQHLIHLVKALLRPMKKTFDVTLNYNNSKYHSCELLSFCVRSHQQNQRTNQYIIRNDVLRKAVRLVTLPTTNKHTLCSVVRFVRACLGLKNEVFIRKMIQQKLFDPIISVFNKNGVRYNLLNSIVIELINFIRNEKIKPLIAYLVDKHYDSHFSNIEYVQTFRLLKNEHEKLLETHTHDPHSEGGMYGYENGTSSKMMEYMSEYEYFNQDSDEEGQHQGEVKADGKSSGSEKKTDGDSDDSELAADEARFLAGSERLKRKHSDDDEEVDFLSLRSKNGGGGDGHKKKKKKVGSKFLKANKKGKKLKTSILSTSIGTSDDEKNEESKSDQGGNNNDNGNNKCNENSNSRDNDNDNVGKEPPNKKRRKTKNDGSEPSASSLC